MNPSRFHTRFNTAWRSGYILMEVMIATAIFALAAVSLALLFNQAISAGEHTQRQTRVIWGLESQLNQARLPRLVPGVTKSKPDEDGVVYETTVTQLQMKNKLNQVLSSMYNITVTARWNEENQPMDLTAQTYVYQP